MGAVFGETFGRGRYERKLRYHDPFPPPLPQGTTTR
ncbi:MAG: hypothetical protein ACKV19_09895 [Verrucomicrobiales bacterium]